LNFDGSQDIDAIIDRYCRVSEPFASIVSVFAHAISVLGNQSDSYPGPRRSRMIGLLFDSANGPSGIVLPRVGVSKKSPATGGWRGTSGHLATGF
jgi:hypothetical protein